MVRVVLLVVALFSTAAFAAPTYESDSAWPFERPPVSELRTSGKKVFLHYQFAFPLWIHRPFDPSDDYDYYDQHWLNPDGDNGNTGPNGTAGHGSFLRERPLPYLHSSTPDWVRKNLQEEVRRAAALGVDGFAAIVEAESGAYYQFVFDLMDAAAAVDPGFKIMLEPDMDNAWTSNPNKLATVIQAMGAHPAAYKIGTQLVVAPFHAENVSYLRAPAPTLAGSLSGIPCVLGTCVGSVLIDILNTLLGGAVLNNAYGSQARSASWWSQWKQLMSLKGVDVALIPIFAEWWNHIDSYKNVSYAYGDWATGSGVSCSQPDWRNAPATLHPLGVKWMAPVRSQDVRPKTGSYWEARNSQCARLTWENAIYGDADLIDVVTWNDYSETTEMAPSSKTQYAFYDLAAYYVTWFKKGAANPPAITKDVLYYFHRKHSSDAVPLQDSQHQYGGPFTRIDGWSGDGKASEIEVVGILKSPGTLQIGFAGVPVASKPVAGGIQSLTTPLTLSSTGTPQFRLLRNGSPVLLENTDASGWFNSAASISNNIEFEELIYHAGGNSRTFVNP